MMLLFSKKERRRWDEIHSLVWKANKSIRYEWITKVNSFLPSTVECYSVRRDTLFKFEFPFESSRVMWRGNFSSMLRTLMSKDPLVFSLTMSATDWANTNEQEIFEIRIDFSDFIELKVVHKKPSDLEIQSCLFRCWSTSTGEMLVPCPDRSK